MVSVNGCAQRSPQLAFRSNANPMGYERPPAGGSQRPVAPLMKLCRYLDTGRSPKPSVTHVTPIRRASRKMLSQSWRDTRRTDLPKPKRAVWEKSQKQKKNQSEQIATGGPERTRTSDLRFRKPLLYPAELRDQEEDVVSGTILGRDTVLRTLSYMRWRPNCKPHDVSPRPAAGGLRERRGRPDG